MKKILQKDEKVLRQTATEVPISDIKTPKIKKILKEMSALLAKESDGVAIAGPQIGYALRIFIISGKIFHKDFGKTEEEMLNENNLVETPKEKEEVKNVVFINPVISRLSRKKEWVPEGCLSVRPIYGRTYRSLKATVTAYNENGEKFTRGGSGLLAQIFQHETDHLNGILFIDHAKDLKEEKLK